MDNFDFAKLTWGPAASGNGGGGGFSGGLDGGFRGQSPSADSDGDYEQTPRGTKRKRRATDTKTKYVQEYSQENLTSLKLDDQNIDTAWSIFTILDTDQGGTIDVNDQVCSGLVRVVRPSLADTAVVV